MSVPVAITVFIISLLVMLAASEVLVRGIDRLGELLGMSRGLLGLFVALGADAPEVSSAISANLVVGVGLPALILGTGSTAGTGTETLAWLMGATVAAGILLAHPAGLSRLRGLGIIGVYGAFVLVTVL